MIILKGSQEKILYKYLKILFKDLLLDLLLGIARSVINS